MSPGERTERTCKRCNHEWRSFAKTQPPTVCPKCKSPYWNREKRTAKLFIRGASEELTLLGL